MDTKIRRLGYCLFFVFVFCMMFSSSFANRKKVKNEKAATEQNAERQPKVEVKGDAFLFDMKIFNKKKKTSVRLDIYRKGDSLAVFARGYLGKGVLKGLVNSDSIVTFFPTESQFYSGKISSLLSAKCFENVPLEKMLVDFFRTTPDKIGYSIGDVVISVLIESPRFRKFRLMTKDCSESMELDYDWQKDRFLLEKFQYLSEDGQFRLDAKRRKFKLNIKLPTGKYKISIPSTASRIYP